nr:hypothetical protein Iba_chr09cCG10540 [Ipomoea batatas]
MDGEFLVDTVTAFLVDTRCKQLEKLSFMPTNMILFTEPAEKRSTAFL